MRTLGWQKTCETQGGTHSDDKKPGKPTEILKWQKIFQTQKGPMGDKNLQNPGGTLGDVKSSKPKGRPLRDKNLWNPRRDSWVTKKLPNIRCHYMTKNSRGDSCVTKIFQIQGTTLEWQKNLQNPREGPLGDKTSKSKEGPLVDKKPVKCKGDPLWWKIFKTEGGLLVMKNLPNPNGES